MNRIFSALQEPTNRILKLQLELIYRNILLVKSELFRVLEDFHWKSELSQMDLSNRTEIVNLHSDESKSFSSQITISNTLPPSCGNRYGKPLWSQYTGVTSAPQTWFSCVLPAGRPASAGFLSFHLVNSIDRVLVS